MDMTSESMAKETWEALKQIFNDAAELPPQERSAYLDSACGEDLELRQKVEHLLAQDSQSGDFLVPVDVIQSPQPDFPSAPTEESPAVQEEVLQSLGKYDLLRELGQGGKGNVYLARQCDNGDQVAVKALLPFIRLSPVQQERFRREAKAASKLQHPGIVRVHEVLEVEEVPYLVMDYVDGEDLHKEIELLRAEQACTEERPEISRLTSRPGVSRFEAIALFVKQVAEALEHAHRRGVYHRDITPRNILLDRNFNPRILDFGQAKDLAEVTITQTGASEGTPSYMSPEQVRGHKEQIDHRTDIYSLGVILYELLTLRRPYQGEDTQQVFQNIVVGNPPKIRELNPRVPVDLETICMHAMDSDPDSRYATAEGLAEEIGRFIRHEAILTKPPTWVMQSFRYVRRNRLPLGAGVAATFGMVFAGIFAVHLNAQVRLSNQLETIETNYLEADHQNGEELERVFRGALELQKSSASISSSLRERIEQLIENIETNAEELAIQGLELLDKGTASRAGTPLHEYNMESAELLEQASTKLHWAASMLPHRVDLQKYLLSTATHPTLSVRDGGRLRTIDLSADSEDSHAPSLDAKIYLSVYDNQLKSDFRPVSILGDFPIDKKPVAAGYYRVLIVRKDGSFAEYSRVISNRLHEYVIHAYAENFEFDASNMSLIEPQKFNLNLYPSSEGPNAESFRRPIEIEPFYMDQDPVTNGEFRDFLIAMGRSGAKPWWPKNPGEDFLTKPVVRITWFEARDYAEWRGKRLPTLPEWQFVARGVEQKPWPLAKTMSDYFQGLGTELQRRKQVFDMPFLELLVGNWWKKHGWKYFSTKTDLEHAFPTDDGIRFLYGNVAEWTDTLHFDTYQRILNVDRRQRITAGIAASEWSNLPSPAMGLDLNRRHPINIEFRGTGFRCAKSAHPKISD